MMDEEKKQVDMKDVFTVRATGDNHAKIVQILDAVKEASVTHANADKHMKSVDTANLLIDSQVESIFSDFYPKLEDHNAQLNDRTYKSAKETGVIQFEIYRLSFQLSSYLREMLSWRTIQVDILSEFINKLMVALLEAKSFEIQRDAVKVAGEMLETSNSMHVKAMENIKDDFSKTISLILQQHRVDQRENIRMFGSVLSGVVDTHKESLLGVAEKARADDIKKDIKEEVATRTQLEEEMMEEPVPVEQPEVVERQVDEVVKVPVDKPVFPDGPFYDDLEESLKKDKKDKEGDE